MNSYFNNVLPQLICVLLMVGSLQLPETAGEHCHIIQAKQVKLKREENVQSMKILYKSTNNAVENSLRVRNQLWSDAAGNHLTIKDQTMMGLCLSQSQEFKINQLSKTEWTTLTSGNHLSLITDLFIYKGNKTTCQVSVPSPQVMDSSDCDSLLTTITTALDLPAASVTSLEPKQGWNILFINSTALHLSKPAEMVCKNSLDPIFSASYDIQESLDKMIDMMTRLDMAIGSNFIASLSDHLVSCGTTWASIQRSYVPSSAWECPAPRLRRFTLMNIGGSDSSATMDEDILQSINSNFKILHKSQVTLLEELEMLKAGEHLLTKLETINSVKENQLQNLITGMNTLESIRLRLRQQYTLNSHLVNLVQNDMNAIISQMEEMINILDSIVLDSRHYCDGLICMKNQNSILTTSASGILEFSKGAQVTSEEIDVLSCHLTKEGKVIKDNKKKITFSNDTTVKINDNEYSKDCLEDQEKCSSDSFMEPDNQMLAGKFFFTLLPSTVHIQCKEAVIIESRSTLTACDKTPREVSFPFKIMDGQDNQLFGWADLVGSTRITSTKPLTWDEFLAGHHEESFLERQAPKDILSLIKTSFAKVGDTSEINSHHWVGISFFLSGLLSMIPICCACLMCKPCLRCRKAKEDKPEVRLPQPDTEQATTWRDKLPSLRFWKKSNVQPPQPENFLQQDTFLPATAPPLALNYSELDRKQRIEEAANKLLELSRN